MTETSEYKEFWYPFSQNATRESRNTFVATSVMIILISSWVFGLLLIAGVPLMIIYGVFMRNCVVLLFGLFFLVLWIYPIYFPVRRLPDLKRFFVWAARNYFESFRVFFKSLPNNNEDMRHNKMFAFHPHGCFSSSFMFIGNMEIFDGVTGLVAPILSKAPIFNLIFGTEGFTGLGASASKSSMLSLMKANKSIALIPGGVPEATLSKRGAERVFIKERKGFIKYAIQYGYTVYPLYSFGESDTHYNNQCFMKLRVWLGKKFGMPGILAHGHKFCPILPDPSTKLTTVIGDPLVLPKIENPSSDEVDKYHSQYIERVVSLFNENKEKYLDDDRELELW